MSLVALVASQCSGFMQLLVTCVDGYYLHFDFAFVVQFGMIRSDLFLHQDEALVSHLHIVKFVISVDVMVRINVDVSVVVINITLMVIGFNVGIIILFIVGHDMVITVGHDLNVCIRL